MKHGEAAKGRQAPLSFGPGPTSSPASSTPRCAASGLDLGPGPKAWLTCRRRIVVSFARGLEIPGLRKRAVFAACIV